MKKYRVVISEREFEALQDVLDAIEEIQTLGEPLLEKCINLSPGRPAGERMEVYSAHFVDDAVRLFYLLWERAVDGNDAACSLRPVRERIEAVNHEEIERLFAAAAQKTEASCAKVAKAAPLPGAGKGRGRRQVPKAA